MTGETESAETAENSRRRWRQRLVAYRFPLAAATALFAVLFFAGALSLAAALACVAVMVAVSMLAPVRTLRERRAGEGVAARPKSDRQRVQAILDTLPAPVLVLRADGEMRLINRAARQVFAGTVQTGTSARVRFRSPELLAMINAALAGGSPEPVETVERQPIERWFEASIVPLTAADGDARMWILHFRDLSESRRIDRMRTDFIANASHELRTPLASLAGFIETLSGPARNDPAAHERFLPIMQEQAERMSRLIDDLLSLSRLETALARVDFAPVDIADLLDHVRTTMAPAAAEAGVELVTDYGDLETGGCRVWGSRDELIQVFTNLIENAIRYGATGGRIEVAAERAESSGIDSVRVSVRDHGPGIPEEHIPRLTERFYRVDVESSRAKKGTGLGLAIVKHILTRHQGRLVVHSELGKGATFTVIIPVRFGNSGDKGRNNADISKT